MITSYYGLDKFNVLLLTLDCCRYDTFKTANLNFLKKIGQFRMARTHGTYTLPAHMSFFMGYLPTVMDSKDPYYSPYARQLWRLIQGRPRDPETVGILLGGDNVLDGYRQLGFSVIGSGGVRWFTNPVLTDLFDEFLYFGPTSPNVFLQRQKRNFPLNNLPKILKLIKNKSRYFLFINCPETHVPYDFGEGLNSGIQKIIEKGAPIWGCRKANFREMALGQKEFDKLHKAQIEALEAIDKKIEKLISLLNKPLILVVCGDHGECFGENMYWGHGYSTPPVMEVPLLISFLD